MSTDLILGAPAPSPAHHGIFQGFSSSCLSIRAQVRELPFDCFLRRPAGGGARAPGGLTMRHFVLAPTPSPPAWARRRVSTDLILGAPAPSPAHHGIFQGFSWSCLLIEAQVRGRSSDRFLRNPAGGGAGAPRGSRRGSLSARPARSGPTWVSEQRRPEHASLMDNVSVSAHHGILRDFSWSCLSFGAQMREISLASFL